MEHQLATYAQNEQPSSKENEIATVLDLLTIVLIAGLHGWRVNMKRLHPAADQVIWLVYVSPYLYSEQIICLGLLHRLEHMSVERIIQELEQLS